MRTPKYREAYLQIGLVIDQVRNTGEARVQRYGCG
jgi:hypothetical protein